MSKNKDRIYDADLNSKLESVNFKGKPRDSVRLIDVLDHETKIKLSKIGRE